MNIKDWDILGSILKEPFVNQRVLSEEVGLSLGKVNQGLKKLMNEGFLSEDILLTDKAKKEIRDRKPKNAIILAAGFGMRMLPINKEMPKGLLTVHGERLIERIIKQLNQVGVKQIDIVVGFLKEKYEYLIDQYGVNLICNNEYAIKNNIYSLELVADKIKNTYIIPCDVWCETNPFSKFELYSWYMVNDMINDESNVRINRKMELTCVKNGQSGNSMIGISYILTNEADILKKRIKELCTKEDSKDFFWEEALFEKGKMIVNAKIVSSTNHFEVNTLEQLRELDENSSDLNSHIISLIAKELKVEVKDINEITILKKGMTNRSFRFKCKDKSYIMRIPGEGTDKLINRENENEVYSVLKGQSICENVIFFDSKNGYKITEYLDSANNCNPLDFQQVEKAMKKLKELHNKRLRVQHKFDLFKEIEFYESLWDGEKSIYDDYLRTKQNIYNLKKYIDNQPIEYVLCHIDSVPDNFLMYNDEVILIDWEYSGMQDPHLDVAMFAIYSLYNKEQIDHLIDLYFTEGCSKSVRLKIYSYIAISGLLWSNWCEYKRLCGVDFGEYSLKQYRYAKEYYNIFRTLIKEEC